MELVDKMIETPDQDFSFEAVPGIFLNGEALYACTCLIGALNENKQEINELRTLLQQERTLNQNLGSELRVIKEKCTNLEERLLAKEKEIEERGKARESMEMCMDDDNMHNEGKSQISAEENDNKDQ